MEAKFHSLLDKPDIVKKELLADGARMKYWITTKTGEQYVYKKDKCHADGTYTYESCAELLASRIGAMIGVPVVDIVLGDHEIFSKVMWTEKLHTFIELSEELSHSFHMSNLQTFNIRTLLNSTANPYCSEIVTMLLFDALIGNSDRHPGNFMYSTERGFYPLFDNGSSFLCYVKDDIIDDVMHDDKRFVAMCETKSKPVLRDEQKLTHKELVSILRVSYPDEFETFRSGLRNLNISILFENLPIPFKRQGLLRNFLMYRLEWFK